MIDPAEWLDGVAQERPELQPTALLVYLSTGIAILGTVAISPVLPVMQSALDVPDARIGLVMSAFTLSVAVTVPAMGWLADRVGRRPVLGGSLLLLGVSGLATLLAPDFRTVLALRAVQGIGFAGILPLGVTILGDLFEGSTEVGAQGFRVTAVNLAGFGFPVVAGVLVAIAWDVPFLLYALAIPVGFAVFRWLPDLSGTERPEGNYLRAVLTATRRPLVVLAVVLGVVRFFTLYVLWAYLPILIVSRGLGPGQVGLVVGAVSGAKMLVATQVRRTLVVGPPRLVLVGAVFASLVVCGVFSLATTFPAFVLVAAVFGAFEGVTAPLQKTVLTRYAPANVRAGVVSLNAAAQNAGKTAAPIAVGAAIAFVSLPSAFVLVAVLGAVVVVAVTVGVFVVGTPSGETVPGS